MHSHPIEAAGVIAASLWILAAAILLARPVLIDGFRYKTRVPAIFFAFGAGIMFVVFEAHVIAVINTTTITALGWFLLGSGALVFLHLFWYVLPMAYPEQFAADEEPPAKHGDPRSNRTKRADQDERDERAGR